MRCSIPRSDSLLVLLLGWLVVCTSLLSTNAPGALAAFSGQPTPVYNSTYGLWGVALSADNSIAYVVGSIFYSATLYAVDWNNNTGVLLAINLTRGSSYGDAQPVFDTSQHALQAIALRSDNSVAYVVGNNVTNFGAGTGFGDEGYVVGSGALLAISLTPGSSYGVAQLVFTGPTQNLLQGLALSSDNSMAYITQTGNQYPFTGLLLAINLTPGSTYGAVAQQWTVTSQFDLTGVALSSDNSLAYVVGGGPAYFSYAGSGKSNENYFYFFSNNHGGQLFAVTLSNGSVATSNLGPSLGRAYGVTLSSDNSRAYVAIASATGIDGRLGVITLGNGSIAAAFTSLPQSYGWQGVALSSDNSIAYVVGYTIDGTTAWGVGALISLAFSSSSLSFSSSVFSSSDVSSSPVSSSPVSSSVFSSSPVSSSVFSSSDVSSSPVSSSPASSSVFSSSPVSTSVFSSATVYSSTGAAAYSDPHFVGFWGQSMDAGGEPGSVYNLLSDETVSISSQLVLLQEEEIHCPVREDSTPCSRHTGTYFGVVGIQTVNGDRLSVWAGPVELGFANVTLNGQPLPSGRSHGDLLGQRGEDIHHDQHEVGRSNSFDHASRPSIYIMRHNHRSLTVHAGLYEIRIDNQDEYVDFVHVNVACWSCMVGEEGVRPEGLLGRTWDRERRFLERETEEELVKYREQDHDIFGCNSHYDRFCNHKRAGTEGNTTISSH